MNKEMRAKIGKILDSIDIVMKKSNEVNKEKFLPEPENEQLKAKNDQLMKMQKTIYKQQKTRKKIKEEVDEICIASGVDKIDNQLYEQIMQNKQLLIKMNNL